MVKMSDTNFKLLCLVYALLALAVIVVVLILVRQHKKKRYSEVLDTLEREKNLIIDSNILNELNKVESMITQEKSMISMREILAAEDEDTLILMTCAGEPLDNNDATHRLIVTARVE